MARWIVPALLLLLAGCQTVPATRSLAERLDRAERMQDWAQVAELSRDFTLSRREELFALTSILDACVALDCDEDAAVAGIRGPLVSEHVREFARAWLEYVAHNPAAARPRFEALSRRPESAWLGLFGRVAYATDARNVTLLREAIADARSNPQVARLMSEDLQAASMVLASLQGDDKALSALIEEGGDAPAALIGRYAQAFGADDFGAAEQALARYARLWGEDQDVAVARMELERARHPPERVIARARELMAAHPRYWRLRFSLAQSLVEAGEIATARELMSESFPVAFATVRLELAIVRNAFSAPGAEDIQDYANELAPYRDQPEALATLASALAEAGRLEDAVELLDHADAMSEGLPATLNVRARIAREAGRGEDYVRFLERAAARTPHDVDAQLLLGLAYADAGDAFKGARIASALRHSPRYVNPERIERLEKAARDADPSFRTASLR